VIDNHSLCLVVVVWHNGSALFLTNKVNLQQAQLVLGWVTVSRFNSRHLSLYVANSPWPALCW